MRLIDLFPRLKTLKERNPGLREKRQPTASYEEEKRIKNLLENIPELVEVVRKEAPTFYDFQVNCYKSGSLGPWGRVMALIMSTGNITVKSVCMTGKPESLYNAMKEYAFTSCKNPMFVRRVGNEILIARRVDIGGHLGRVHPEEEKVFDRWINWEDLEYIYGHNYDECEYTYIPSEYQGLFGKGYTAFAKFYEEATGRTASYEEFERFWETYFKELLKK